MNSVQPAMASRRFFAVAGARRATAYLATALGLAATTLLAAPLRAFIDLSNVALFYVLIVVVAGGRYGRGVAIFAALAGSLLFAYVFVPPHFSLAITDLQYLLSALIMLVVALLVGHLTADLRSHAELSAAQAAQTKSLYEFARALTATRSSQAVIETSMTFLADAVGARRVRFIAVPPDGADGGARSLSAGAGQIEAALIRAALDSRRLATERRTGSGEALAVLPLHTAGTAHGAIGFAIDAGLLESAHQTEYIETLASLVAVALERTHYLEMAGASEVQRAAESLRSTILASLSHDIRTPLTALVGTADTLLLGDALPPARQRSLLRSLREQALAIHQLVNNLLDMARLQSGSVELNLAWQPVEDIVGATLQQIRAVAGERTIEVAIAADLPPLRIDATLMERALWNLLENALKYSPVAAPVDLSIARDGETIDIAVADRGPGLPDGDVEALFGLFARGRAESSVPGAGIGLAIVKSIAEVHHGSLRAERRAGGGAVFHLGLPVGESPNIDFGDEA